MKKAETENKTCRRTPLASSNKKVGVKEDRAAAEMDEDDLVFLELDEAERNLLEEELKKPFYSSDELISTDGKK